MNPEKREYNGWILCPSTRFLGKFYYFNPATGEAVWNFSDIERRMISQPNFSHSQKWHTYPEPESPPEDTSNPWGYQPDFRVFPQASPPLGHAVYPKYTPNAMLPRYMPWGMPSMPQTVYMPPMTPTFNPIPQTWPNFRANQKQFIQDKCSFPNMPYMQKVPNFNQGMNRQVFGIKPKSNNFPVFSQTSHQNREVMNKRSHTATDPGNVKEPLFKRLRSQIDLQNENIFGESNNLYRAQSFESSIGEKVGKPTRMPPVQQKTSCSNHCDCCMLSKTNENLKLSSQFSKSQENLTNTANPKEHIFQPSQLERQRSLESLLKTPSEVSSNFSMENSFVFPLNKSDSKMTSAKPLGLVKKVQNSTVSQSGQDNKKIQSESSDSKLSETDLRYILMAKRKNFPVTELQETGKQEQTEVMKIKTSYSETNKPYGESFSKKRVTFDLGVEDLIAEENPDANAPHEPVNVVEPCEEEPAKVCYVVADVDALLSEFDLIEQFVKSDGAYILLIPAHISREIEATCAELSGSRRRVLAARQISRHIARQGADNHAHIMVQPGASEAAAGETDEPTLNCCLGVYDEGHSAMLITNNKYLYDKACSYDVECYTTEDIKEYIGTPEPEVSFDIQKVGDTDYASAQNGEPAVPINCSRRKLFEDTCNQFFLSEEQEAQKIVDNEKVHTNDRNPFFDQDDDLLEETQLKVENLKLQEGIDMRNYREWRAGSKNENANVFINGVEAKEYYPAARKELKSINVYNLDGLLKSFNIKSKDMEDRIVARMDEYVCIFCQIMESIFVDIVKDMPCIPEDCTKPPLQSRVAALAPALAGHRAARALADQLAAALDTAYVRDDRSGRLLLKMNPNEFVKMFACGTLLVKVLRSIIDDATLQEGEGLLEQLERSLERWEAEPRPNTAATPGAGTDPRPEYKKKPSEVLQFLTKHYPEWQSYKTMENYEILNDKQTSKAQVAEKSTSKVISTFGRNLGLLKLDPGKPLTSFNENKENNNSKEKYNNKLQDKEDAKNIKKSQTIRSLELEPRKVKEIDVKKRERDDKELTKMLEQMMEKQPLTKRYDLKSIIINKNNKNTEEIYDSNNNSNINPNKDLKLKIKIGSTRKTAFQANIMTIDNIVKNSAPKKIIHEEIRQKFINRNEQITNAVDKNKTAFDLDVLDYSDIVESVQEREESMIGDDSSSNRLVIVESDHCNDVTTTQHDQDDSSPNIEGNNDISNESDIGIENHNNNENIDHDPNENCDSGIESYQAYSLVQLFLIKLSNTFIIIKQFIEASISDMRNGVDEGSKDLLNQNIDKLQESVIRIINNLKLIIKRESNPESALRPMLMKGASEAETDKRIIKYRSVVSKCLSQARVLQRSLQILQRIAHRDLRVRDLSDVSDNYSNIFE